MTTIIAVAAMVLVLLAPAHAPATPVFSALVGHEHAVTATGISLASHVNHHAAVHDHVHDIMNSPTTTLATRSVPQSAWRAQIAQGAVVSLDFTPFQPPRG